MYDNPLFNQVADSNLVGVHYIAEGLYLRDYILPDMLPKRRKKVILDFLGGDVYSPDLIKRLVFSAEEKNESVRYALLLLIFTGWDVSYFLSLEQEDFVFANFFPFSKAIKVCAVKTFANVISRKISLEGLPKDKQVLEAIIKRILSALGHNDDNNLEKARRTFLYYSIFEEKARFEQIQNAMYMPVYSDLGMER